MQFCQQYLTYECCAHQRIQIPLYESKDLEDKGCLPPNIGYQYTDDDGQFMMEYHVDLYEGFQEKIDNKTEFGGKLSVRIQLKEHSSCLNMMSVSSSNICQRKKPRYYEQLRHKWFKRKREGGDSCGHDKQQPDGLNAENMSKLFGGSSLTSTI